MNITANNVASKLFVAFVAAAMLFTLATPAKAQTAEELQAQINALMAQIAALQSSTGGSSATVAACTFTRSLTVGSQGEDVKCLQNALTPKYFTNAGGATGYFGSVTQSAVAAWQAANGISPAVGYFGPVSQAKYNAMMTETPADDSDDSDDSSDDSDDSDDSDNGDLSGEASLNNMEIDSASDDSIEEGAEDAEVAVATIEFQDGDAMITRLDVEFDSVSNAADVWDVLDEVALMVDGDEVARMSASDEDDYLDTTGNAGTLRFSGLDLVGMEDEEVEVTVVATIQNTVDSNDQGTFNVSVNSMRFVDADDVTETVSSGEDFGTNVTFTIDTAGVDDEIIVKSSSEDPDGTTLELKDNAKSDWYNVFTFDLDTDDSVNDIELTTVYVTLDVNDSDDVVTYAALVDDVELVIDGVTIDAYTPTATTTAGYDASNVLAFDVDGDVTIAAGERVSAELMVKFKSLALANEGATVHAAVTTFNANSIDAEGADGLIADDLNEDQIRGSADGDVHTLRTAGIAVENFETDETATVGAADDGSYGTYEITFDVTTIGGDELYIPLTASAFDGAAPATTRGAVYTIEKDGVAVASSSADALSASLTRVSGGDTSTSGYVRLDSGDTATFKLTVTFNPGSTAGQYTAILNSVNFAATGVPATDSVTLTPAADYDSDPLYITS